MSVDPREWVSRWKGQDAQQETEPMAEPQLLPPLPWFLGEPPTYPEAVPLAIMARQVLRESCMLRYQSGPLILYSWGHAQKLHVREGLGIWWQDKLMLLATATGDVWAYHAGSAWEEALYALAAYGTAQPEDSHGR